MHETLIKTHLIITDIHNEYHIKWCGSIINTQPVIENGKPIFVIRSKDGYVEVNTTDMNHLEKIAKKMTAPKGRQAITTDVANIYIKEIDGNEKLMGVLTHDLVKQYAQMFDKIGYR